MLLPALEVQHVISEYCTQAVWSAAQNPSSLHAAVRRGMTTIPRPIFGCLQTAWGAPSLIDAAKLLLRAALRDSSNQRFVLLCEASAAHQSCPLCLQLACVRDARTMPCHVSLQCTRVAAVRINVSSSAQQVHAAGIQAEAELVLTLLRSAS